MSLMYATRPAQIAVRATKSQTARPARLPPSGGISPGITKWAAKYTTLVAASARTADSTVSDARAETRGS